MIIGDNSDSRAEVDDAAMRDLAAQSDCKYLAYDGDFNISAPNNLGARSATGQVLIFVFPWRDKVWG